jgi:hypothetical protein
MWDIFATFLQTFWIPLTIITIGGGLYSGIIWYMGGMPLRQILALFFTGIIVITCVFLPFNWSLQNAGEQKAVTLFFFDINIGGSNFIALFRDFVVEQGLKADYVDNALTFFLAFLEELAKLTLLILCIRRSLRGIIMIVYLVLLYTIWGKIEPMNPSDIELIVVGVLALIGLITVWILMGTSMQMTSVAHYIYSISLVAIGFAFAENIKYMIEIHQNTGGNMHVVVNNAFMRSIFGYMSHTFFSMVCVAIYARGRFAFLRVIDAV